MAVFLPLTHDRVSSVPTAQQYPLAVLMAVLFYTVSTIFLSNTHVSEAGLNGSDYSPLLTMAFLWTRCHSLTGIQL